MNASDVGDIDILVADKDLGKACELITSLLESLGSGILFTKESAGASSATSKKYLYASSAKDIAILQIDIFTSYHWRGMSYFSYSDAIKHSNNMQNIIVCNTKVSALIGAFKDMVYGGKIKASRVMNGYTRQDLISFLNNIGYSQTWSLRFLKNYDKKKYRSLTFICMWLATCRFQDIYKLVCYIIYIVKLHAFPNRRNSLIALYGPDGGGKSSVIDIVANAKIVLEAFDRVIVRHTRPHIIPPMSKLIPISRAKKVQSRIVARSITPINQFKAVISIFYYGVDYLLEKIYLNSIPFDRRKTLYIYDRYVFEFGYQQTFSKSPKILLRFLKYIAVKPSINFFLSADSKIIASRKSELKEHDINVQNLTFKELDEKHNLGSVFIDTGFLNQKAAADEVLRNLSINSL